MASITEVFNKRALIPTPVITRLDPVASVDVMLYSGLGNSKPIELTTPVLVKDKTGKVRDAARETESMRSNQRPHRLYSICLRVDINNYFSATDLTMHADEWTRAISKDAGGAVSPDQREKWLLHAARTFQFLSIHQRWRTMINDYSPYPLVDDPAFRGEQTYVQWYFGSDVSNLARPGSIFGKPGQANSLHQIMEATGHLRNRDFARYAITSVALRAYFVICERYVAYTPSRAYKESKPPYLILSYTGHDTRILKTFQAKDWKTVDMYAFARTNTLADFILMAMTCAEQEYRVMRSDSKEEKGHRGTAAFAGSPKNALMWCKSMVEKQWRLLMSLSRYRFEDAYDVVKRFNDSQAMRDNRSSSWAVGLSDSKWYPKRNEGIRTKSPKMPDVKDGARGAILGIVELLHHPRGDPRIPAIPALDPTTTTSLQRCVALLEEMFMCISAKLQQALMTHIKAYAQIVANGGGDDDRDESKWSEERKREANKENIDPKSKGKGRAEGKEEKKGKKKPLPKGSSSSSTTTAAAIDFHWPRISPVRRRYAFYLIPKSPQLFRSIPYSVLYRKSDHVSSVDYDEQSPAHWSRGFLRYAYRDGVSYVTDGATESDVKCERVRARIYTRKDGKSTGAVFPFALEVGSVVREMVVELDDLPDYQKCVVGAVAKDLRERKVQLAHMYGALCCVMRREEDIAKSMMILCGIHPEDDDVIDAFVGALYDDFIADSRERTKSFMHPTGDIQRRIYSGCMQIIQQWDGLTPVVAPPPVGKGGLLEESDVVDCVSSEVRFFWEAINPSLLRGDDGDAKGEPPLVVREIDGATRAVMRKAGVKPNKDGTFAFGDKEYVMVLDSASDMPKLKEFCMWLMLGTFSNVLANDVMEVRDVTVLCMTGKNKNRFIPMLVWARCRSQEYIMDYWIKPLQYLAMRCPSPVIECTTSAARGETSLPFKDLSTPLPSIESLALKTTNIINSMVSSKYSSFMSELSGISRPLTRDERIALTSMYSHCSGNSEPALKVLGDATRKVLAHNCDDAATSSTSTSDIDQVTTQHSKRWILLQDHVRSCLLATREFDKDLVVEMLRGMMADPGEEELPTMTDIMDSISMNRVVALVHSLYVHPKRPVQLACSAALDKLSLKQSYPMPLSLFVTKVLHHYTTWKAAPRPVSIVKRPRASTVVPSPPTPSSSSSSSSSSKHMSGGDGVPFSKPRAIPAATERPKEKKKAKVTVTAKAPPPPLPPPPSPVAPISPSPPSPATVLYNIIKPV